MDGKKGIRKAQEQKLTLIFLKNNGRDSNSVQTNSSRSISSLTLRVLSH